MRSAIFSAVTGSKISDGVLRGVSVITEGPAIGHDLSIDAETLKTVLACAQSHTDGVLVKSDHGSGFDSIVGVLKKFRIEGPKLLADLSLLKSHEDYSRIIEIAESMPGSVGLSISFSGENEKVDGETFARCAELYSVDFVDRPAANPSGLFSAAIDCQKKGMAEKFDSFVAGLKSLVGASDNQDLTAARSELQTATNKITELSAKIVELEKVGGELDVAFQAMSVLERDLKAARAEVATLPAKIELAGSQKAQQILAAIGQPQIPSTPPANPAAPGKTELKGLAKTKAAFAAQLSTNKE